MRIPGSATPGRPAPANKGGFRTTHLFLSIARPGTAVPGNAELQLGIHGSIYRDDARKWSEPFKTGINPLRWLLLTDPEECRAGARRSQGAQDREVPRYPLLQCINAERGAHDNYFFSKISLYFSST